MCAGRRGRAGGARLLVGPGMTTYDTAPRPAPKTEGAVPLTVRFDPGEALEIEQMGPGAAGPDRHPLGQGRSGARGVAYGAHARQHPARRVDRLRERSRRLRRPRCVEGPCRLCSARTAKDPTAPRGSAGGARVGAAQQAGSHAEGAVRPGRLSGWLAFECAPGRSLADTEAHDASAVRCAPRDAGRRDPSPDG